MCLPVLFLTARDVFKYKDCLENVHRKYEISNITGLTHFRRTAQNEPYSTLGKETKPEVATLLLTMLYFSQTPVYIHTYTRTVHAHTFLLT